MDISDTKIIFEIYITISGMGDLRLEQSIDMFKLQLIARLRKNGHRISAAEESNRLYLLNGNILLYFSPIDENPDELKRYLFLMLRKYNPPCIIAYGIRNESGACIYRFEMPE